MCRQINSLGFTCVLALLATYAAKRYGFFNLTSEIDTFRVKLKQLASVFLIYIVIVFFLAPALFLYVLGMQKIHLLQFQFFSFAILIAAYILYLFNMERAVARGILFGRRERGIWENVQKGAIAWVFSYPVVLFVNALVHVATVYFWGEHEGEQQAVLELKKLLKEPLVFAALSFMIVTAVPFIEELLFRGFLQSYLRSFCGRAGAIGISSILFALVHYSKSQGIGNLELIPALFILSCYMGFLYEKEQNLFAPIGLHMTFNAITVLGIFFHSPTA